MAEPLPVNYVITMTDSYDTLVETLLDNHINPIYSITYNDSDNTVENFYYNSLSSEEYWTFASDSSLNTITVDYNTYETILSVSNGPASLPIKKVEIIYYDLTDDFVEAVKTVLNTL